MHIFLGLFSGNNNQNKSGGGLFSGNQNSGGGLFSNNQNKNTGGGLFSGNQNKNSGGGLFSGCLLYTSPSPRDKRQSRMPSSA